MAGKSPNILSGRLSPDDPRRVKDSAILSYAQLGGLDIVKGEIVVESEYSADNPFSRIYGIDKGEFAGQMMQAFKNTRKVRADGRKIVPAWISHNGGYEIEESNTISGSVGSDGRIICADRKTQRGATWNPVITLDGEVVPIKGGIAFPVGHWRNVKYSNSVIDIDYGICTRRIEIFQSGLLESWIFNSNPGGTVRIVHNHSGDSDRFELPSYYAVDDDVEEVTQKDFDQGGRYKIGYPLIVQASLAEGVDPYSSRPIRNGVRESWNDLRNGAGNNHNHTQTWPLIQAHADNGMWLQITRYHTVYDTSALPDTCDISAVTEKYYGKTAGEGAKGDPLNCTPALCVVRSKIDDVTDIDSADYALAEFGGPRWAPDISYASWTQGAWNTHTYNATGRGWVNKTGYTLTGHRLDNDQDNVQPTWAGSQVYSYVSWESRADPNESVMTVTYTVVLAPTVLTVTPAINITGEAARIKGNVTATGGENPTRYLQYGKTTGYELGSLNKGVGGTGIYLHDLSGLDTGTLYYFRAYATNSGGTGYGAQANFTTLSDIEESLSISFGVEANNERKLTLQAFISLETESSMGRKLGFPLSASLETESSMGRKLGFPLSSLIEVEVTGPLHIVLLKAASCSFEIEVEAGRQLQFPLISSFEIESALSRKLVFPLSALIGIEAAVSYRMGLEKSASILLEVETEAGRHLVIPLESLIEVEAVGNLGLIKPLSALIEIEAVGELALLIPMVRKQQLLLEITTEEQVTH